MADTQGKAEAPQVLFIDELPANRHAFWTQVRLGMIAWDQLNAAVCGIARLAGRECTVYDQASVIAELRGAFEDSSDPLGDALTEFFRQDIEGARLGPRTPLMLYTNRAWPANNGLGAQSARTLPPAGIPEPVEESKPEETNNVTSDQ